MPRVSTSSQVQSVETQPTRRRAVPKPSDDGHASTTPKKVAKKTARQTPVKRKVAIKKPTQPKLNQLRRLKQ